MSYFETKILKDIAVCVGGMHVKAKDKKKEPGENRYFCISLAFLNNVYDGFYIENPLENKIAKHDDILMVRTGLCGKVITGVEGCVHNSMIKIEPITELNKKYLYHFLNSKKVYKELNSSAEGTNIPNLKNEAIYKLEIPFPDIQTQNNIAGFFDCLDNYIFTNNKISENLKEQLNTLFFKYSKVDEIDNDFLTLGEITEVYRIRVTKSNYESFSVTQNGTLMLKNDYFFKKGECLTKVDENFLVPKGSFVYNPTRISEGAVAYNDLGMDGCVSVLYVPFFAKENFDNYLKVYLSTDLFKKYAEKEQTGSVTQYLQYPNFSRVKAPRIDLADLIEFNKISDPIFSELKRIESLNKKINQIKTELEDKIFGGEILIKQER